MLCSDEGINLELYDGKVLGTILGNVGEIKLFHNFGTELDYLDGSFDGSNDGQLDGTFLGDSLISISGKVLVYYEGILLGSTDCISKH